MNNAKVAVMGIGNVLMGDDAAGPYLIKMLKARCIATEGVALIDAGTAGLALPGMMEGYDAVIIVDTVRDEGGAGAVHRYDRATLLSAPGARPVTPHDPGLHDALLLSDLGGNGPREVVLIGVVPDRVNTEIGLSAAVRNAMAEMADAVLSELARMGAPMVMRDAPLEPDLWWEQAP